MCILPGHLAYFFMLTLVPTITIVSYIASLVSISIEDVVAYFNLNANSLTAELIKPVLEHGDFNVEVFALLVFGLYIISNGADSIIVTANNIYGIQQRSFKVRRIKALLMAVILIFLFLFIAIFPVLGNFILSLIEKVTGYSEIFGFIDILRLPLSWFIIFLFIKILYVLAPDKRIEPSRTNGGALFASVGWVISTQIYLYYIEHFADYSILYSNLANIAILMIWLYILALIFAVGMAINCKDENNNYQTKKINMNKKWYDE